MDESANRDVREPAAPIVRETCRIIEPPSLEEMPLDRQFSDAEVAALKKKVADFEAFVLSGDTSDDPPPEGQTP